MGPFAGSAYGPLPILGEYSPYPRPPVEPVGPRVLEALKALGKISLWLLPGVAIASTAIANEPGMAQAAANWKSGMAARMDGGVKQLLSQLASAQKNSWIAADRGEYERVLWMFDTEMEALRSAFTQIGGMIDEVAAGYRGYWLKLAATAGGCVTALLTAKLLQRMPHTAAAGMLYEKIIATATNGAVAVFTLLLRGGMQAAGDILGTMMKKDHQFGYVFPGAGAAVNFKQATIDTKLYPSYQEPTRPGELPPGYQNFDWVAPGK
ncbi:hypothetical protein MTP10_07480 [Nonomuraea sp. 3-1Str]|uniref:hypothetical protein n=1 Tax=unclassified Nonomuraea TaxID=2593643 RepID=UPI00286708CB|nr:hypothetical protein [Nonomuraea sp. 3-1Str]MDR8408575.1 hypothetical protein [Nonomuraea sp. 3-1Str]